MRSNGWGVESTIAYNPVMAKSPPSPSPSSKALEVVEPLGARVLIRKDEDKKTTKSGIHLPDKLEIPTITGRIVSIAKQVELDADYPIRQYDRVLFHPKNGVPVDFEGDNRLFVIPVEDIVAVFRKAGEDE
jgi:chaperonin GroES